MARSATAAAATAATALALAAIAPGSAVAAVYTVDITSDPAPSSSACAGRPADCSLRRALAKAQAGDVVIVPANAIPYEVVRGRIPVRGGVSIEGAGAASTVVSGGGRNQVFGLSAGTVTVRNLSIVRGHNDSGKDQAGAITGKLPEDNLTLEGVAISESDSPSGFGGAIELGGELVVLDSRFSANSTTAGGGGAIDVLPGGGLTVADSVFAGNTVAEGAGGAVLVEGEDRSTISSSTFSGNAAGGAEGRGGALAVAAGRSVVENSTFAGNGALDGGAVFGGRSPMSLINDTLARNSAPIAAAVDADEGGAVIENTIFAEPLGGGASCAGEVISAGSNLEEAPTSSCGLAPTSGDLIGAGAALGPLSDDASPDQVPGGPPQTLAPAPSSPAVGAGSPAGCAAVGSSDERGFPRLLGEGRECDIGAVELLDTQVGLAATGEPTTGVTALTVAVEPASGLAGRMAPPGGGVQVSEGGTLLASAPLDATGVARLTIAGLASGRQVLTARYGGDVLYAPSSSTPLTVTVVAHGRPPRIAGLSQSHRRWLAAGGGRRAGGRRAPVGTSFRFTLSDRATVELAFARLATGVKRRGRCVGARRRDAKRSCVRLVAAGALRLGQLSSGPARVRFAGAMGSGRRLHPGRYQVTVIARNGWGASRSRSLRFTLMGG